MSTPSLATRRDRVKKQKPNVLRVAGIACLLGLIVVLMYFMRDAQLLPKITTVECSLTDASSCPEVASNQLQQLVGTPLLFSPLQKNVTELLTPLGVSLVSYKRVAPSTLKVIAADIDILCYLEFEDKQLAVTGSGSTLVVPRTDEQLLILQSLDAETNQEIAETSTVPSWFTELVKQLEQFTSRSQVVIESVVVHSPFEAHLQLVDQQNPIILNPQESNLNLARLSSILDSDQVTALASESAVLDVRFRLPVLR